ncbi:MAG TPA: hypothetical protein VN844_05445 [Pyrinomonadaceae bacterium]|nr:hypothetical protein [Pyrinomonadaceae bacterium]
MKQSVLCAIFIISVGVTTAAQNQNSPATESSILDNEPDSISSTNIGLSTKWDWRRLNSGRAPSPFINFIELAEPQIHSYPLRRTSERQDRNPKKFAGKPGFQWSAATKQSLIFLGIQHGYALTQPKTRRDLKGPFFKDYVRSVKSLHGWEDGGKFFTNYVAHPMQGALLGFIQIQNDPKGRGLRFNESSAYWRSRLRAFAWSAAWSTQFEIGPVSQASIGNVGLHGKQTYVDLVVTPTAGLGLIIVEDFLDQYLIRMIERNNSRSFYIKVFSRMLLNPTRSAANLLQFRTPWYRERVLR